MTVPSGSVMDAATVQNVPPAKFMKYVIEKAIDTFSKVHFYTHECILAFCMLVSFIILLHTSSFRSQFVSDSYLWQLWAISLQVN